MVWPVRVPVGIGCHKSLLKYHLEWNRFRSISSFSSLFFSFSFSAAALVVVSVTIASLLYASSCIWVHLLQVCVWVSVCVCMCVCNYKYFFSSALNSFFLFFVFDFFKAAFKSIEGHVVDVSVVIVAHKSIFVSPVSLIYLCCFSYFYSHLFLLLFSFFLHWFRFKLLLQMAVHMYTWIL